MISLAFTAGCSHKPQQDIAVKINTAPTAGKTSTPPTAVKQPATKKPAPPVNTEQNPIPKIGITQKYMQLNWIDNGKTRMKAKAKEFRGDEITQKGTFTGFSADLYQNGKLTATISAPVATVDTKARTVVADNNVTMKSMERQTSLVAKKVTWYSKENKVIGTGGVKINSTTGQITADKIETDTALRTVKVMGSGK